MEQTPRDVIEDTITRLVNWQHLVFAESREATNRVGLATTASEMQNHAYALAVALGYDDVAARERCRIALTPDQLEDKRRAEAVAAGTGWQKGRVDVPA